MTHDDMNALRITAVRMRTRVEPASDGSDCIWWTRALTKGYGVIRLPGSNGRLVLAHRVLYQAAYGYIPKGLVIDHVCHTRSETCVGGDQCLHRRCLNLDHLEAVTFQENVARGYPARKTECNYGHPFDEKNTVYVPSGARRCRRCCADRQRRYYQRRTLRAAGAVA